MLAHAEPHFLSLVGLVLDGFEIRALVTAVAKRLILTASARAPPVRFTGFNVDAISWIAPDAHDLVRVFDVWMRHARIMHCF